MSIPGRFRKLIKKDFFYAVIPVSKARNGKLRQFKTDNVHGAGV